MGSTSDWETLKSAAQTLDRLGIVQADLHHLLNVRDGHIDPLRERPHVLYILRVRRQEQDRHEDADHRDGAGCQHDRGIQ